MKTISNPLAALAVSGVMLFAVSCGGGGGGGDAPTPVAPDGRVAYTIGAPSSALGQSALAIQTVPRPTAAGVPASMPRAAVLRPLPAYDFPAGPDGAGDTLPKVTGRFDPLSGAYDSALASKAWIDLAPALGGYKVAVSVTGALASGATGRGPSTGEIVVAPREAYAAFAGRLRLSFNTTATPACLGWDAQPDGTFEAEQCMTFAQLDALQAAGQPAWPIPLEAQTIAGSVYRGWRWFALQFDFSVGALQIVESNYAALAATPAGTQMMLACAAWPAGAGANNYAISWLDRNGSGRFDTGDDVRFDLVGCATLFEGQDSIVNQTSGVYELRGYERNVGAAPTFNLEVIEHAAASGTVTGDYLLTGGFTLRAPGITASTGAPAGYRFDTGNLLAAGSVAAKSLDFYPDVAFISSRTLAVLRKDPAATALGWCRNVGASATVTRTGTGALAAGEQVQVAFANCDIGTGVEPVKFVTGVLTWTLAEVTNGPGTDWTINADARFDFTTTRSSSALRRTGEAGMSIAYVLDHSFAVALRPAPYAAGATLGGVLRGYEDGRLVYELGCFAASHYGGSWALADYQLTPNHVIKTANKVMTVGMRQGESFVFKASPSTGLYYPDYALASLLGISAPECTALGVPASGVSGGDTNVQFDTWPAGDGDVVALRLYDRAGTLLKATTTSWAALAQ